MPTITTVDAAWAPGPVEFTDAEARRFDTAMFLGDGSNNGVRGGIVRHGDNSLAVSVNGSDQVAVQSGVAVIPAATGLGVYRAALSAATSATGIASRNATNPRIDLVVMQIESGQAVVKTIDGTPSSSPSAPALPASAVELARLNVPALSGGAVTVTTSFRQYATALGGTMWVETAARLPGSGVTRGQRAIALDTQIVHVNAGGGWIAQHQNATVTPGTDVNAVGVVAARRDNVVVVSVNLTVNATLSAGARLFYMPTDMRPTFDVYGTLVDTTGEGIVRIAAMATGDVLTTAATIPAGRILRGQIVVPL